jgi:hypothetical protein
MNVALTENTLAAREELGIVDRHEAVVGHLTIFAGILLLLALA